MSQPVHITIKSNGEFLTELTATELPNGCWRLERPLVFRSRDAGRIITAPAGFVTDFASVPRIPFAFWLFGAVAHKAAVIHDFLYRTQPAWVTREMADAIFLEAMAVSGVPAWRRYPMYSAVRVGGWVTWNNHAPAVGWIQGRLVSLSQRSRADFEAFIQVIADRAMARARMA